MLRREERASLQKPTPPHHLERDDGARGMSRFQRWQSLLPGDEGDISITVSRLGASLTIDRDARDEDHAGETMAQDEPSLHLRPSSPHTPTASRLYANHIAAVRAASPELRRAPSLTSTPSSSDAGRSPGLIYDSGSTSSSSSNSVGKSFGFSRFTRLAEELRDATVGDVDDGLIAHGAVPDLDVLVEEAEVLPPLPNSPTPQLSSRTSSPVAGPRKVSPRQALLARTTPPRVSPERSLLAERMLAADRRASLERSTPGSVQRRDAAQQTTSPRSAHIASPTSTPTKSFARATSRLGSPSTRAYEPPAWTRVARERAAAAISTSRSPTPPAVASTVENGAPLTMPRTSISRTPSPLAERDCVASSPRSRSSSPAIARVTTPAPAPVKLKAVQIVTPHRSPPAIPSLAASRRGVGDSPRSRLARTLLEIQQDLASTRRGFEAMEQRLHRLGDESARAHADGYAGHEYDDEDFEKYLPPSFVDRYDTAAQQRAQSPQRIADSSYGVEPELSPHRRIAETRQPAELWRRPSVAVAESTRRADARQELDDRVVQQLQVGSAANDNLAKGTEDQDPLDAIPDPLAVAKGGDNNALYMSDEAEAQVEKILQLLVALTDGGAENVELRDPSRARQGFQMSIWVPTQYEALVMVMLALAALQVTLAILTASSGLGVHGLRSGGVS